jgi:hypothetical protein
MYPALRHARTHRTSKRKKTGLTPAVPASPNDIVSAPPAKAAIPVNSPTISRMPTVVSAIATTFATHG